MCLPDLDSGAELRICIALMSVKLGATWLDASQTEQTADGSPRLLLLKVKQTADNSPHTFARYRSASVTSDQLVIVSVQLECKIGPYTILKCQ